MKSKTVLVLAIMLGVIILPTSVFAQDFKDKESHKETRDLIKEKRADFKDQFKDNKKNFRDLPVTSSLEFSGNTTGWAYINGKAVPASVEISGEAGRTSQSALKITGNGTVSIADRTIPINITGHARGNHILLKGTTDQFESVVIHLNGLYAPVNGESGTFAVSFNKAGITNESNDHRIPLVMIGQINVRALNGTEIPSESIDDLAELFS